MLRWKFILALMFGLFVFLGLGGVFEYACAQEQTYIYHLDLTVAENPKGEISIVSIGYYSPFRRYSWFRTGDVIMTVNQEKTTVYVLMGLGHDEKPWIKYRRGAEVVEQQIGLEKVYYGLPPYIYSVR